MVAVFINGFIGVTADDLTDYWQLQMIATFASTWPLLWLWLVPLNKDVEVYRELRDKQKKAYKTETAENGITET